MKILRSFYFQIFAVLSALALASPEDNELSTGAGSILKEESPQGIASNQDAQMPTSGLRSHSRYIFQTTF